MTYGSQRAFTSSFQVGHYPMLEKPDEFNRDLREALKEFATKR